MRRGVQGVVALLWLAGAPLAAAQEGARPESLEACYLDVAARKSTADAVHLAREICDAVFRRGPRSLSVLEGGRECVEWWFDAEGRYESADQYCGLEPVGERQWKLACQWKGGDKGYTFVVLREEGQRLEPVGELRGKPVGPLFTSLVACIGERAGAAKGP